MRIRKSIGAAMIAGAAAFVIAGCAEAEQAADTAGSAVTSAAADASAAVSSAAAGASEAATSATDQAKAAAQGLTNDSAQTVLRTAVNPDTSDEELETVVDTSTPGTEAAIKGYAAGSSEAGYTPDVYTVSRVASTGDGTADVTVSVASPHSPQPVDITLPYVKLAGDWKLSADAVNELAGMMGSHGG